VFANGGYLIDPYFIGKIIDAKGSVLFAAGPKIVCEDCNFDENESTDAIEIPEQVEPSFRPLQLETEQLEVVEQESTKPPDMVAVTSAAPRVISEQNAYLIRSMMMDVVRRGTGKKPWRLDAMTWQVRQARVMSSVMHGFLATTVKLLHRSGSGLTIMTHWAAMKSAARLPCLSGWIICELPCSLFRIWFLRFQKVLQKPALIRKQVC
jgi:hypothetical protein